MRIGIAFAIALAVSVVASGQTTRRAAQARNDGGLWKVEAHGRTLALDEKTLAMSVSLGQTSWNMGPAGKDDLVVESDGKRFPMSLLDAKVRRIEPYSTGFSTGLRVALRDFEREGKVPGLSVTLLVALEEINGDLLCEVIPAEKEARIKECLWPKGFDGKEVDRTVVPFMQGMLLPRDWPKRVSVYDPISYGRGLYMPWFGQEKGGGAAMVIFETPADGAIRFEHPAGGPTRIQTRWLHSLGKLAYGRRARMVFLEKGGYVELAKRYRRHVIESGTFVSLKEKIARSPIVGRMIGTPVIHTSILYHTQPESSYYDKKNPAANHQLVTFEQREKSLRALAEKGVGRAYVHLDGWGARGYDNLHPDILPPCPEAGGMEGMKKLAEACEQIGYIFAVHDNYRDYYHDAASYDAKFAVIQENGQMPFGQTWAGGKQSILCSKFAPGHVEKNHRALLEAGVKLKGAYLDVFSVVPGDECYSPEHPVKRAQSLYFRGKALDLIRTMEGVVSSEEPADWAIPHIDLVHHAPFALDPNPGGGEAMGIPIPLYNLVYHDALLTPWALSKGGWGIPKNDSAYLHGMLNGGIPYVSEGAGEEELKKVRSMCALHGRVGTNEMLRHELLDGSMRRQRTTFSDGTSVTVDFDRDLVDVRPELSESEIRAALEPRK